MLSSSLTAIQNYNKFSILEGCVDNVVRQIPVDLNLHDIGDEFHYILQCPYFEKSRITSS